MSKRLIVCLSLSLLVCLSACEGVDNISREYRCYFVFDTELHPLPCQLTGILGNPGQFCKIESSSSGGIRLLKTTRNYDGAKETVRLTTAKENQVAYALGANNCIIIGTSSYDNMLVAYDGQCPNCLADYSGISYPLSWQKSGLQLYCAKCQRAYDANNGVIASGSGGRSLMVYKVGLYGFVLTAGN